MNYKINVLCAVIITLYCISAHAQNLEDIPWDPGLGGGAPVLVYQPVAPQATADPAFTRRSLFPSAETLPGGTLEFTCRGLLTTELAFGITDWLEVNIKNIPLFMLFSEIGVKHTFWSGGLRARLIKSDPLTLTAHADGVSILGWAGFHTGLSMRLGNKRFSLHGSAALIKMWQVSDPWPDDMFMDSCAPGGDCHDSADTPTQQGIIVSGGMDVRVHRKVKLQADVSYYRDGDMDMLTVAPSVRLHGKHFATDLGILLVRTGKMEEILPLPLVNFSVSY